jgi:hypothetical protein
VTYVALALIISGALTAPWALAYRSRGKRYRAELRLSETQLEHLMDGATALAKTNSKQRKVIDDLTSDMDRASALVDRCAEPGSARDELERVLSRKGKDSASTVSGEIEALPMDSTPRPDWIPDDDPM